MIRNIKKLTGKEDFLNDLLDWIKRDIIENGGWTAEYENENYIYFYDEGTMVCLNIDQSHADIEDAPKEDIEAITNQEFKKKLSPETRKTFSDIIDEL
jgi:hypothetical protein